MVSATMKIWWGPVLLTLGNFFVELVVCAVTGTRETAMNSGGDMEWFLGVLNKYPDLLSSNIMGISGTISGQTEPKLLSVKDDRSYDLKPKTVETHGRQVDSNEEETESKLTKMLNETVNNSGPTGDSMIQMATDARTGNRVDEGSKKLSSFVDSAKQQVQSADSVMTKDLSKSLTGSGDSQLKEMNDGDSEGDRPSPMEIPSSRFNLKWAENPHRRGDEDKQMADFVGLKQASQNGDINGDPVEEGNQSSQFTNPTLNPEKKISANVPDQRLDDSSKSKVDEKPEPLDIPIQQLTGHVDGNQEGNKSNTNVPPVDELSNNFSELHDKINDDRDTGEKESNKTSSFLNTSNLESLKSTDLLSQANKIASQTSFANVPIPLNDSQLRQIVSDPKLVASLASNGLNVENKEELLKTLTNMNNTNGGLLGAGLSMLSSQSDSQEDKPQTFGELVRMKFSMQHWKKLDLRDYFPNLYERFFGGW